MYVKASYNIKVRDLPFFFFKLFWIKTEFFSILCGIACVCMERLM